MFVMTAKVDIKKILIILAAAAGLIIALLVLFGGNGGSVSTATTPVSGNPKSRWAATTASRVRGPKMPSMVRGGIC